METPLTKVVKAKKALEKAEQLVEARREELHRAVRHAGAAGEPLGIVAQVLGVTRQRVSQITKAPKEE